MRRRQGLPGGATLLIVLSACHAPSAAPGAAGPADSTWPDGDYELVADMAYRSQGPTGEATRRVTHRAVLTVGAGGALRLMSTVGVCQPDPRDRRVRNQSTFLCGEATYRIWPAGGIVAGTVSVRGEVMVSGERRCVEYQLSADRKSRTCVRYETPLETRWTTLTERLRVKRLMDGGQGTSPGRP